MRGRRNGLVSLVAMALILGPFAGCDASAAPIELSVRNQSVVQSVLPAQYQPPAEPLAPVRLAGARNGEFTAQVVVTASVPIPGLKAGAADLTGPATIPASAVRIRFAMPDGASAKRGERGPFDSLESSAPDEVTVYKQGLAVQPIWISVTVPPDARPGDYTGAVTISADGAKPISVPLVLKVIDWTLGDPNTFAAHLDIIQSPESVAMAYDVPLWSEKHLALLDRTFALLRPLAVKTIYISAIRRTHFGNEHAMVRWYRDEQGELAPNFDHVEKYLDVATRHLGKVPGVIVLCWEPIESMGHAGGAGGAGRTTDKPIQFTLWDRATDKLSPRTGPAWGSPESKAFWKRLSDGLAPVLAKRGLSDSLLFGLIGDARPTKVAMDDIVNGVKDPRWAMHSHHYTDAWQGYPISMCVALWGIHLNIVDPAQGRGYGWQNPNWLSYYPRELSLYTSLVEQRYKLEMWLGAFSQFEMRQRGQTQRTARGLGRIGGDFWEVTRGVSGRLGTLAGRFPESYWGQLNLNYCIPYLLGKGKDGAVPTVRSENFREAIQEAEARVFIEKAIVPDEMRAKVGEELAGRARKLLDERIRMINRAGSPRSDQVTRGGDLRPKLDSDWQQKNAELFEMAGQVARKLGQ